MTSIRTKRDEIDVVLDAQELVPASKVGTLRFSRARPDVPVCFEYDASWLKNARAFELDPRLELFGGEQHPPSNHVTFGVFQDASPDRWGRILMERREGMVARKEKRRVRRLGEMDFLLGVHDIARLGALRFRLPETGRYLDDSVEWAAPPVTSLRELAHVSQKIEQASGEETPEFERWLITLLAPGTSLGGARPKASFTDTDGSLWLAKFPAWNDRYDIGAWEFVTHQLAHRAHIQVPSARLEKLTDRYGTFCAVRFDRTQKSRRMFASAMTLLERRDGDGSGSYLDLAQLIADQGASGHIENELEQLFRRVVFNVLVSNRDDHLRNHGFIRSRAGWRLAPAYDMNPTREKSAHVLTLDGHTTESSIDAVMETAPFYRLRPKQAEKILRDIREVVKGWKDVAKRVGIPRMEIDRMAPAFEPF